MLRRQLIMSGVAALPLIALASCKKPDGNAADNAAAAADANAAMSAANATSGQGTAASKAPGWLQSVKKFVDTALSKTAAAVKTKNSALATKLTSTQSALDDAFNEFATDSSVLSKIFNLINDALVLIDAWAPGFTGVIGTVIQILLYAAAAALGITLNVSEPASNAAAPSNAAAVRPSLAMAPLTSPMVPAASLARAQSDFTTADAAAKSKVSEVATSDADLQKVGDQALSDLVAKQKSALQLIDASVPS
jgi:hypothetical protein